VLIVDSASSAYLGNVDSDVCDVSAAADLSLQSLLCMSEKRGHFFQNMRTM